MSLLHLVLLLALLLLFSFAAIAVLSALPSAEALLESRASSAIVFAVLLPSLGLLFALVAAWPIARAIHLTPLRFWTPRCPHCSAPADQYGILERNWPSVRLVCPNCGGEFILHMESARHAEKREIAGPTYALRWPEFLGLWQRLS